MRVAAGQANGELLKHLRTHLVGYVALLAFAVVSGVEAADGPLAGQNTVGSEDIIGNEVLSDDIGNGRIFNLDIADNVIQSGKVRNGTLTGADFGLNSLDDDDIAEATFYGDNSLTTDDVNESSLFNDESLQSDDFFAFAARSDEIVTGAVGTSEVTDDSLDADELAADSVGSSEIATAEVGPSELAPIVIERSSATIPGNDVDTLFAGCPGGDAPLNVGYAGEPGVAAVGTDPVVFDGQVGVFAITLRNVEGDVADVEVAAMCLEG